MKTISIRQLATVKRVAQNVSSLVTKKNKLLEQIRELNKECEDLINEIEGHEVGVRILTGHSSEELITRVVEDTGKMDRNGKPIKITKYEPKSNIVVFNEEKKVYEIHDEVFSDPVVASVANPVEIDHEDKEQNVQGPTLKEFV
jgi:hypothetical protein|nr:MAG TPA: hypothetical protein [Crassvirales sp.]